MFDSDLNLSLTPVQKKGCTSNEGDAASVLASCMAKLSRKAEINGNDLHALTAAAESFAFLRELDRSVKSRFRINEVTGKDDLQVDLDMHHVLKRIKQGIFRKTGIPVTLPEPKPIATHGKPKIFRDAERKIAREAKEHSTQIMPSKKWAMRVKPRRAGL